MLEEQENGKKAEDALSGEPEKGTGTAEPPKEESREEEYSFLQETVKDEQITGKRIWSSALGTAGRGLLFGAAACLAFCALTPRIQKWFDGRSGQVTIPADEEEEESPPEEQEGETEEEPVTYPALTVENYREMNEALYGMAVQAETCVADVRAVRDDPALASDESGGVAGIVVWQNAGEVLVLAPSRVLDETGQVSVTFVDSVTYPAVLKKRDQNLGMAVFSVDRRQLVDSTRSQITVAQLGNSNVVRRGDALICLGRPFGHYNEVSYGVASSTRNYRMIVDGQVRLLSTDITAAASGSAVLFNLKGEVVGLADQKAGGESGASLLNAYAISGIKEYIEMLSNGQAVPYLGIHGIEVTESLAQSQGLPRGVYVQEIEADSPAMQAGLQSGDVITNVDGTKVTTLAGYRNALLGTAVGQEIRVRGQRQGAEEYVDISFGVTVGSLE